MTSNSRKTRRNKSFTQSPSNIPNSGGVLKEKRLTEDELDESNTYEAPPRLLNLSSLITILFACALLIMHYIYLSPMVKFNFFDNVDNKKPENIGNSGRTNVDTAEYTYDDFWWKFDVGPLHEVMWDPEVSKLLDKVNITDSIPPKRFAYQMLLSHTYGPYIAEGSHENHDREMYVVKFSSAERGYGLFAKIYIKTGTPLGVYTGVVSFRGIDQDTDYVLLLITI